MADKPVVEGSRTLRLLREILRQVEDGSLDVYHLMAIAEHRNPFDEDIDWSKVYNLLEIQLTFDPEQLKDYKFWIIPVQSGLTLEKLIKSFQSLGIGVVFDCDSVSLKNPKFDRGTAYSPYKVKFKKRRDADEELKNTSGYRLNREGYLGINLTEILLLQLGYFLTTNRHLDHKQTWTLCVGTRYEFMSADGEKQIWYPIVKWDPEHSSIRIDLCREARADHYIRAREVILK